MRNEDIQRIAVAVESSPHGLAALEAAMTLAAWLEAEILAVYVEDRAMLGAADLPPVKEIGFSGSVRVLNSVSLLRHMRAEARRLEALLLRMAADYGVRSSFRVVHGEVAESILDFAKGSDLIAVGRSRLAWAGPNLGSVPRSLLAGSLAPLFLVKPGLRLRLPLMVYFDGSPAAAKALRWGARISNLGEDDDPTRIQVLLSADSDGEALKEQAEDLLHTFHLDPRYHVGRTRSVDDLLRLCAYSGSGALVLPAEVLENGEEALQHLIAELDIPILLVR